MAVHLSNARIDRLGDRLRTGRPSEDDLRLLDEYRRSYGKAYDLVVGTIRGHVRLEPTGRPAKSTSSIVEKLNRETIRLSQVQDFAGCRVVVPDVDAQERAVRDLLTAFPAASVVDRRVNPSHGYRAVHVIVTISGRLVEIQVRSALQHLWAELSEKLSDTIDPALKYGGGDEKMRAQLQETSRHAAVLEAIELKLSEIRSRDASGQLASQLKEVSEELVVSKQGLADELVALIDVALEWQRRGE